MLVIAAFEHTIELEQALAQLERSGIPRRHLLVALMDSDPDPAIKFRHKLNSRQTRSVEVGIACATAFSAIGACLGFVLFPGPIICGLIAALLGFLGGSGLYVLLHRSERTLPGHLPEITVIVQCPDEAAARVTETLWRYYPLTVGQVRSMP